AAACLSQGEARQAVASGQALPLGAVARSAGGQIANGCLANEGGRLVYRLKVETGGRVVERVIDGAAGQGLQQAPEDEECTTAMRVLVVEDDKELNRQLREALADAGYVVDAAEDGEEGHFLGDTEPYDAVVLDLGLPVLDGISVLERW